MIEETLQQIKEIRDFLGKQKMSSLGLEECSQMAVKLSTLKVSLGEHLGGLESELEASENAVYFVYRNKEEMSQEDAKRQARADLKDRRVESAKLDYLRRDIGDLITSLQSRTKVLLEEKRDTNFGEKKR